MFPLSSNVGQRTSRESAPKGRPISIEKPANKFQLTQTPMSASSLQGTNLIQEIYAVKLMDPVSVEDTTLALTLTIQQQLGLINYGGTDFPEGIELCCDELNGYMSSTNVPTHCVAVSQPVTVSSVTNPGGIIGYNVLYDAKSAPIWDITNINTLNFRLKLFGEEVYRDLPSAQPITCIIKLSRVIF